MKSFSPIGLLCLLASTQLLSKTCAEQDKPRHLRQGSNNRKKIRRDLQQHPPTFAPAPTDFRQGQQRGTMMTYEQHGQGGNYRQPYQQQGVIYANPYPNYYDPYYQDPYYKPFPTERPTPRPSPNPTDRPTPFPTPNPTPFPTRNPTPRPTTPEPSAAPSPAPSPAPSAAPSAEPSSEPSAVPSETPSATPTTAEPSEEPTESSEPSENPTESYEPSENPTETTEPSETPTETQEPSETPTSTDEPSDSPTVSDLMTLAEFICADENEDFFGSLCILVSASPALFAILNNNLFINFAAFQGIPGFDVSVLQVSFRNIPEAIPQPMVPDIRFPNGFRNLEAQGKLTLFAPTNDAIDKLLNRPLNYLFDETDADVVEYFDTLGLDVTDNDVLLSSYLLTSSGRITLNQILLTHILNHEIFSSDLLCNAVFGTLSGQPTQTLCEDISLNAVKRFQIGIGNGEDDMMGGYVLRDPPQLFATNTPASNGVLHVVDEIILPQVSIPDPIWWVPYDHSSIIIINSALIAGAPRLSTQPPSNSPA